MVFYIRLRIKRGGKEAKMARTARVKENAAGTAHYHLMSRANDKRFLFEKGRVKDSLVDALKRAAESSGIGQCFAGSVPKGSGRSQVFENMVKYHCLRKRGDAKRDRDR